MGQGPYGPGPGQASGISRCIQLSGQIQQSSLKATPDCLKRHFFPGRLALQRQNAVPLSFSTEHIRIRVSTCNRFPSASWFARAMIIILPETRFSALFEKISIFDPHRLHDSELGRMLSENGFKANCAFQTTASPEDLKTKKEHGDVCWAIFRPTFPGCFKKLHPPIAHPPSSVADHCLFQELLCLPQKSLKHTGKEKHSKQNKKEEVSVVCLISLQRVPYTQVGGLGASG